MNIKSFLFCLSLIVFLYSCEDEVIVDAPEQPIEDVQEDDFPVIIDTVPERLYTEDHYKEAPYRDYNPFYFGKLSDTVHIGCRIYYQPDSFKKYLIDSTNITWNQYNKYFETYKWARFGEPEEKRVERKGVVEITVDQNQLIKECYPVVLTNKFNDTVSIGRELTGVSLMMQALNEYGVWQDVEKRMIGLCGTGAISIMLPPNESVILLAPIYKGKYTTKYRLKFGDFYSKPFMGTINKNQFVIPD